MHATAANEIVDGLNVMLNMTVSPDWMGALRFGDQNAILDLGSLAAFLYPINDLLKAPGAGGFALTAVNNTRAWTQYVQFGDSAQAFVGKGSDGIFKLTLTDSDGNKSNLDAGGLTFTDSTPKSCDLSITDLTMSNGEDLTDLSAGELNITGPSAKIKVGDETQLSDDLLKMGATTEYADDHLKFDTTNLSEDLLKMGSTEYADDHIKIGGTVGSSGAILVSDGTTSKWADLSAANGDILIYNNGWYALGKGSDGDVLMMQSGLPAWVTPSTC